jgi:chemotaxis signal transduction protein cheW
MRVYRLAWLSSRLVHADVMEAAGIRGEMLRYIGECDRTLEGLEHGDEELRLRPAADADVQRELAHVKSIWTSYRADVLAAADAAAPEARAAAEMKVAVEVNGYAEQVNELVRAYDEANRTKIVLAENIGLGILVAALIIFAGASYLIITQMLRPLAALTLSFARVAGREGDLRQKLHADREDEIGRIVSCFNNFVADLRRIVKEAQECSAEVSALAENLWKASIENSSAVEYAAAAVTDMADSTQKQNDDIRTLASSVSGIAAQVKLMQEQIGGIEAAARSGALITAAELTHACADSASAATNDIAEAAQHIASCTEEGAAAIEQQSASLQAFAAAAEHLSGLSAKLDGLVGKFKV